MVKPRKTRPHITERLLVGGKELTKQTNVKRVEDIRNGTRLNVPHGLQASPVLGVEPAMHQAKVVKIVVQITEFV